jgi:3-oxoacyl-[acyl-carrier-protein] synthase-3
VNNQPAGKEVVIRNASVKGIVSCLPPHVIENSHFNERFKASDIEAVSKITGVYSRRWVDSNTTTSDLCFEAAKKLLLLLDWPANSIDCLIFVSQTPDFKLPATACILQERLDISTNCIAFDVNLGCSGYPYALWLGMTIVQSKAANRVLVAVGDTISKILDPDDRSTAMLFGDAGSVTAIEWTDENDNSSHFVMGTDGKGCKSLIVPRGASRVFDENNNQDPKSKYLHMNGGDVFNFTLKMLPSIVERLIHVSSKKFDEIDYFIFHQANLFMLNFLSKKINIPKDKVPININEFGNTSSASIPLLMTTTMAKNLKVRNNSIAMFGFGVGFSWAAASLTLNSSLVLECINYEHNYR